MNTPLHTAGQVADHLEALARHTCQPDTVADPADLARLLAELTRAADCLPQLLTQLVRWIDCLHTHGRLTADDSTPGEHVTAARAALRAAARAAQQLATGTDNAHQHTAQLALAR